MAVNLIVIAITCLMTGFIVVWFGPSPSRRRRICGPSAELTDCRSASERVSDCRMSMPIPCEQMPRPSLEQGLARSVAGSQDSLVRRLCHQIRCWRRVVVFFSQVASFGCDPVVPKAAGNRYEQSRAC
jgi:hypothetical protein